MDLRTKSLNFNVFQLFICLFLTADIPSPHDSYMESNPPARIFSSHNSDLQDISHPLPVCQARMTHIQSS